MDKSQFIEEKQISFTGSGLPKEALADSLPLILQIITGKITLEEAYCKAKTYVDNITEQEADEFSEEYLQYTRALSFIEETLAEKYMKSKGYYCDNSTGKMVWKKG